MASWSSALHAMARLRTRTPFRAYSALSSFSVRIMVRRRIAPAARAGSRIAGGAGAGATEGERERGGGGEPAHGVAVAAGAAGGRRAAPDRGQGAARRAPRAPLCL